jgi:hypothetical protein
VRWIFFLMPSEASGFKIRSVAQAEMLALIGNEAGTSEHGWEAAFPILSLLVGGASCFRMNRGSLPDMVDAVHRIVSGRRTGAEAEVETQSGRPVQAFPPVSGGALRPESD